jgi:hypothetical protein
MALACGRLALVIPRQFYFISRATLLFLHLSGNIISAKMKKIIFLAIAYCLTTLSCQKSVSNESTDNGTGGVDSLISPGDMITYEILTDDTTGWAGVWNEPDGTVDCNPVDSITYGSPIYNPNGWRHSFVCPTRISQPIYIKMENL